MLYSSDELTFYTDPFTTMHIHQLKGYIQDIYLVEYPDRLMLLDGCSRPDVNMICDFITDTLNRPLSHLKVVCVTHMHPDHAGGAHALRKKTGARVLSSAKEQHWYRGLNGILMHITDIVLTWWVAGKLGKRRKNVWYPRALQTDISLRDGERIPGFDEWQVLEMPGHTDRDLSLWHTPSSRVYVADLMVKVKGKFIPPFPVFHPNQYQKSIVRLIGLQPASILLAHGGEVRLEHADYDFLLKQAPEVPKTHWRATKQKLKRLIQRGI